MPWRLLLFLRPGNCLFSGDPWLFSFARRARTRRVPTGGWIRRRCRALASSRVRRFRMTPTRRAFSSRSRFSYCPPSPSRLRFACSRGQAEGWVRRLSSLDAACKAAARTLLACPLRRWKAAEETLCCLACGHCFCIPESVSSALLFRLFRGTYAIADSDDGSWEGGGAGRPPSHSVLRT